MDSSSQGMNGRGPCLQGSCGYQPRPGFLDPKTLGLDRASTWGRGRVGPLTIRCQAQKGRQWAQLTMMPRGILGLQPDQPIHPRLG